MAKTNGRKVSAADFNGLSGSLSISTAYPSESAAAGMAAAILGKGFGTRGYGESTPGLSPVVAGSAIKGSPWVTLRDAIAKIASYQGVTLTGLPTAAQLATGQEIAGDFDWETTLSNLDANRFNSAAANMTATASSLVVSRTTAWGTSTGGIVSEVTVTFASEDAARHFFNTNGALTVILAHANTSNTQNADWNTTLASVGTISFGANRTTSSGSKGTAKGIGYYQLTTGYQTIFDGTNIGSGMYAANDVLVEALTLSPAKTNGGNGTQVRFRVTLTDQHTNAWTDSVAGNTSASFGFKKAAAVITNVATPTFALTKSF